MSTNKFEKRALNQINELNEGLGLTLLKFFFKSKVKKALKIMKDDPEVQSAVQGIEYHGKELKKQIKDFEKKYGKKPSAAKYAKFPWEK
tara:strand:- start:32917 stop:33183 length:267 start_codon:yes stop_codon:yes gene_type:complete